VAAPVVTYASAIALNELAISATAGAQSSPHRCRIESRVEMSEKIDFQLQNRATMIKRCSTDQKGNCTFLGILGRHREGICQLLVVLALERCRRLIKSRKSKLCARFVYRSLARVGSVAASRVKATP